MIFQTPLYTVAMWMECLNLECSPLFSGQDRGGTNLLHNKQRKWSWFKCFSMLFLRIFWLPALFGIFIVGLLLRIIWRVSSFFSPLIRFDSGSKVWWSFLFTNTSPVQSSSTMICVVQIIAVKIRTSLFFKSIYSSSDLIPINSMSVGNSSVYFFW